METCKTNHAFVKWHWDIFLKMPVQKHHVWPISRDELSINQMPEFTKDLFFHKEVNYQ